MPPGGIAGYETGSHSVEKTEDGQNVPANAVQTRVRGRAVCAASPDEAVQTRQTVQNARRDFHMSSMSANSTAVLPELDKLHRQGAVQTGGAVADGDVSSTRAEPVSFDGIISATRFKEIAGPTRMMFFMGTSYKNLLGALEAFEKDVVNDHAGLTVSEKLGRIAEMRQQADQFVNHNLDKLTKRADDRKYADVVNKRLQAADALLLGLRDASRPLYVELLGRDMSEAAFVPANEVRSEDGFASGAQSSVDKIRYKNGVLAVFKSEQNGALEHPAALKSGIPEDGQHANLSGRDVATFKLDQLLELGIVPKTAFAIHNSKAGSAQLFVDGTSLFRTESVPVSGDEKAVIGPAMISNDIMNGGVGGFGYATDEIGAAALRKMEAQHQQSDERLAAIGKLMDEGHLWATKEVCVDIGIVNLSSPSVQKSLADTHILDLLSGQVDRNSGNLVFVQSADGQAEVKLIDNNLSFGSNFNDLSEKGLRDVDARNAGVILRKLPRLIDAATAVKVENMTVADLREALADTGLTDAELDAAGQRLQGLKEHIESIKNGSVEGGRIVDAWDEVTFAEQLEIDDNYVSRSLQEREQQVFNSPKSTAMLVDDVVTNEARNLKQFAMQWSSGRLAHQLGQDLNNGGTLFTALQNHAPQALSELLLKLSPEDLSNVLRARESLGPTNADTEVRHAADIAQRLMDANAVVTGPDGEALQQSRSEFMAWTLNALLGGQRLTTDENNMA